MDAPQQGTRVPERGDGRVLAAPLTGAVDPVMLEFVTRIIDRAEGDGFDAVAFELDTPGGLSTSMDDIVREFVTAKVPVLVLVAPESARAASAGVFLTYAADVAAMAPGTNIGSATPISSGGEQLPDDLRRKVINDAVASITELAKERGRDPRFAEAAIREARNIGARAALEAGVIEHVATDVRALLRASDGQLVQPKGLRLQLVDAHIERAEVPISLRVLRRLVDPNLLLLLFGVGIVGLAFELVNPGAVVPGVVGVISLLLAMFGLSVLPASGLGIALLVLAAALLAGEAIAPGGGILGATGATSLLAGALVLFDDSSGYGVSPWLAGGMSLALFAFFGVLLRTALAARRLPPRSGSEALVGMEALVRRPIRLDGSGTVLVDGELWSAVADSETNEDLTAGALVQVQGVEGLQVRVAARTDGSNIKEL